MASYIGPKKCSCLCPFNHPGKRVCDNFRTVPDAEELRDRVCVPCGAEISKATPDKGQRPPDVSRRALASA